MTNLILRLTRTDETIAKVASFTFTRVISHVVCAFGIFMAFGRSNRAFVYIYRMLTRWSVLIFELVLVKS